MTSVQKMIKFVLSIDEHIVKRENIMKFRDSSMVEHSAVNRRVASSSLARGAKRDENSKLNQMGQHG